MKQLSKWISIVAAALAVSTSAAETTKVAIGYVPASDWLPALIAKEKGYFDQNGLDAKLTNISLISNIPAALMANSLQIGATTPTILIDAADAGMGLTAIAGATRVVKDPAIFSIVAREGVSIKTAQDLEGKRVGVPGIRALADVLFRKWLSDQKADASKINIVETPFPQMGDLLKSGQVDAVTVLEPFRTRIVSNGIGYRVADYVAEVNPDLLGSAWIARREWLDSHPNAAQAFRKSLAQAIAFIREHPEQARAIEKTYLGVTSPVAIPYALNLERSDFDTYVRIGREIGYLRKEVDTSALIYP